GSVSPRRRLSSPHLVHLPALSLGAGDSGRRRFRIRFQHLSHSPGPLGIAGSQPLSLYAQREEREAPEGVPAGDDNSCRDDFPGGRGRLFADSPSCLYVLGFQAIRARWTAAGALPPSLGDRSGPAAAARSAQVQVPPLYQPAPHGSPSPVAIAALQVWHFPRSLGGNRLLCFKRGEGRRRRRSERGNWLTRRNYVRILRRDLGPSRRP